MRFYILFILFCVSINLFGQPYKNRVIKKLDAYFCINSDSIYQFLENRKYNSKLIEKDIYIANMLDSLFYDSLQLYLIEDLKKIFRKNICITEDKRHKFVSIDGGYLTFEIFQSLRYEKKYSSILMSSRKDMYSTNRRKNKMYFECQVEGGILYFINYFYMYKFIDSTLKNHHLTDFGVINIELKPR